MHTGEGQFVRRGKTCLSRDVQNHGAKRQRREFPSQDMIPCATLHVPYQGLSQDIAESFSLLVHFRLPKFKLTVETEGEGKMQAPIPASSSGIFLLLLGCSCLAGSSVTSHPLCLSLIGEWKHPRTEAHLHLLQTKLNINGHGKSVLATWKFFKDCNGLPKHEHKNHIWAISDTSCSFSFFRDISEHSVQILLTPAHPVHWGSKMKYLWHHNLQVKPPTLLSKVSLAQQKLLVFCISNKSECSWKWQRTTSLWKQHLIFWWGNSRAPL